MTTLRETAQAYEPPQYKNVADLDKINVDVDVKKKTKTNSKGEEYDYFYTLIDEVEYRVPKSVLTDLKDFIEEIPDLQFVKVTSKGEGMGTKYNVIPLPN